jgi:hypothetical protein
MTFFRYQILYPDGQGNQLLWGLARNYPDAERSLANLRALLGVPYLGYIKRMP